jgi:hypothetical protein
MKLSVYFKALTALVGGFAVYLGTVATDPAVAGVLPANWTQGLAALAAILGTFTATFLIPNKQTVEQIDKALGQLSEAQTQAIVAKWSGPAGDSQE